MKEIVAIIFTAVVFYTSETGLALDRIKDLTELRKRVVNATDDLHIYNIRRNLRVREIMDNFKNENKQNINLTVIDVFVGIHNEIKNAKKKGILAGHCYQLVDSQLQDARSSALLSIDNCTKEQQSSVEGARQQFITFFGLANTLLSELDAMIKDCTNIPIVKFQICMNPKLPEAHRKVAVYENRVNSMKEYGEFSTAAQSPMLDQCLRLLMKEFERSILFGRTSVTSCINATAIQISG